jgi:hypothetical protein
VTAGELIAVLPSPVVRHATDRAIGPALAERYLELLLNGLSPVVDRGPVPPPPDEDALGGWLAGLARPST